MSTKFKISVVLGILIVAIVIASNRTNTPKDHLGSTNQRSVLSGKKADTLPKPSNPPSIQAEFSVSAGTSTHPSTNQVQEPSGEPAATQAFHEARRCHVISAHIRNMKNRMTACTMAAQHEGGYDDLCKRQMAEFQASIQTAETQISNCNAVPAQVERDYYDAVVKAAKSGDVDAQICYVRGNFKLADAFSKEELTQYQDTAQHYVDEAIARGDWRVIELLGSTGNYLAHAGGLMSSLDIGDPYTVYKMNRLLRLGAADDYAKVLDSYKNDYTARLTSEQISKADAWAQAFYALHFANSPSLTAEPKACADGP